MTTGNMTTQFGFCLYISKAYREDSRAAVPCPELSFNLKGLLPVFFDVHCSLTSQPKKLNVFSVQLCLFDNITIRD